MRPSSILAVAAILLAGCASAASSTHLARSIQLKLNAPAVAAGSIELAPAVAAAAVTGAPTVTRTLTRAAIVQPASAPAVAAEPTAQGRAGGPPCGPNPRGVACAAP